MQNNSATQGEWPKMHLKLQVNVKKGANNTLFSHWIALYLSISLSLSLSEYKGWLHLHNPHNIEQNFSSAHPASFILLYKEINITFASFQFSFFIFLLSVREVAGWWWWKVEEFIALLQFRSTTLSRHGLFRLRPSVDRKNA